MPRVWVCVEVRRGSEQNDVYITVDAADWNDAAMEAEQKARQRSEYAHDGHRYVFRAVEMALRE